MPEGDTIRRLAERIDRRFVGSRVEASVFRHPRLALTDLAGTVLVGTASHGKHLFLRFDDRRSLHVHLLMQGRVRFGRATGVPEWRRRFEVSFAEGGRLTGVDIPLLHLVPTERESSFTDHLGPDVCGDRPVDEIVEQAVDRMLARADLRLGGSLLDQRNAAGFGNIYAVETPFVCGLSPYRPVLGIVGLDAVVSIGAALIRTNAARGPQNTTGRRLDRSDHWILSGHRRACPVCDTRLDRRGENEVPWRRRTVSCPSCQPDDAEVADVDRARRLLALHPAARTLDWDDLAARVSARVPVDGTSAVDSASPGRIERQGPG